jgi:nitrate/nitrite-specific signal transduction histidine kinase
MDHEPQYYKPSKKVNSGCSDIARGNYRYFSARSTEMTELGKLANAFNSMAVKIRNAQEGPGGKSY